jgi:hypothetical protein
MSKSINKQLHQLAKKLPNTFTIVSFKTKVEIPTHKLSIYRSTFDIVPSAEPIDCNDTAQIDVTDWRLHPVNHERRLRNAYDQEGLPGINKYVKWVSTQNELINTMTVNGIVMDITLSKTLLA